MQACLGQGMRVLRLALRDERSVPVAFGSDSEPGGSVAQAADAGGGEQHDRVPVSRSLIPSFPVSLTSAARSVQQR